jgi:hypothetical protein
MKNGLKTHATEDYHVKRSLFSKSFLMIASENNWVLARIVIRVKLTKACQLSETMREGQFFFRSPTTCAHNRSKYNLDQVCKKM